MKTRGLTQQGVRLTTRASWRVALILLLDGFDLSWCKKVQEGIAVETAGTLLAWRADSAAEEAVSYIQRRVNVLRQEGATLRGELQDAVNWARAMQQRTDAMEETLERKDAEVQAANEHRASQAEELRAERDRENALQESLRESEHENEELRTELNNLQGRHDETEEDASRFMESKRRASTMQMQEQEKTEGKASLAVQRNLRRGQTPLDTAMTFEKGKVDAAPGQLAVGHAVGAPVALPRAEPQARVFGSALLAGVAPHAAATAASLRAREGERKRGMARAAAAATDQLARRVAALDVSDAEMAALAKDGTD